MQVVRMGKFHAGLLDKLKEAAADCSWLLCGGASTREVLSRSALDSSLFISKVAAPTLVNGMCILLAGTVHLRPCLHNVTCQAISAETFPEPVSAVDTRTAETVQVGLGKRHNETVEKRAAAALAARTATELKAQPGQ